MEKFEEKIIDLVDVIAEPRSAFQQEVEESKVSLQEEEPAAEIGTNDLESLVSKEVERLIRSRVDQKIDEQIREILIEEIEKAISREIESLKRK